MLMKKTLLTLSALSLMAVSAQAELLVYEGFDYADGTTLDETNSNLNGGTALSGSWVTTDTTLTNALFEVDDSAVTTWGSLTQTGSALKRQSTGGVEAISRAINVGDGTGGTVDLDAGTDLWFSVLIGTRGTTQFAIGSGSFADGGSGSADMGGSGDGFGLSMTGNTVGTVAASAWASGTKTNTGGGNFGDITQFFVGHITWGVGEGVNDTFDLYAVGTDLALGTAIATQLADVDESLLDTITLSTNRGPGLDEIRIGTTYADVVPVPEPSTYAMLAGLLALTSVMIRRRK